MTTIGLYATAYTGRILSDFLDRSKRLAITSMVTGSCSLLFSFAIVVVVFRSHVGGLSTTYHRLLVGMSISDMVSSLPYVLSSSMVPKEMAETVWNARGNLASCRFQAFTSVFGILVTSGYTCSLCLYFLSVVKFGKSEEYIRRKFEPYFHLVPISAALITAIIGLISDAYAPNIASCFINDDILIDDQERGDPVTQKIYYWLFLSQNLIILPCVIIASMSMMYFEVRKVEMKNTKYGVGSLRLKASTLVANDVENPSRPTQLRSSAFKNSSRSYSKSCEKRRAIMQKGIAYSLAYLATYTFPIIFMVKTLGASCKTNVELSHILKLSFIFFPFQGGFNFCVFMSSRVWNAKKSRKNKRTWWSATKYAFTSRGMDPKKKKITTPPSNIHKSKRQPKVDFSRKAGFSEPIGDKDEEKQEEDSCAISNLPTTAFSSKSQPHFPTSHLLLEREKSGASFSSNMASSTSFSPNMTSTTSFSSNRTSRTLSLTSSLRSDGPGRTSLSRTSISRISLLRSSNTAMAPSYLQTNESGLTMTPLESGNDNSLRRNSSDFLSKSTLSFDRSSVSSTLSTARVEDFLSSNQLPNEADYIEQLQSEDRNEDLSQLKEAEEATRQPLLKTHLSALSEIDETPHIPVSENGENIAEQIVN